MTAQATGLTWDVYAAPAEPAVTDDRLPARTAAVVAGVSDAPLR
jgi:hypothetical protein